jgi:hypothetical protein
MKEDTQNQVAEVSDKELLAIRDAVTTKFGYRLQPGETLGVDVERTKEHAWATIVVEMPDSSFRLELEAASQPHDQPGGEGDHSGWDPTEQMQLALDFLDSQLEVYFDEDRAMRFHDDWRIYDFEGSKIRFRGAERRPDLEMLADQWLEAGGPPDPSEMN